LAGKRGAGATGQFFVGAARFADGVLPAVIPVDAGFVALDAPDAVACPEGFAGLAVGFKRDQESAAADCRKPGAARWLVRPLP